METSAAVAAGVLRGQAAKKELRIHDLIPLRLHMAQTISWSTLVFIILPRRKLNLH